MSQLLNGKEARDAIAASLARQIALAGGKPTLAILQVGDRPDSTAYIRQKLLFAEKIGAQALLLKYPESVTEAELLSDISLYNSDQTVHGIIPQLPLPPHLNPQKLIEAINPDKDVDGLTSASIKALYTNNSKGFLPATARGIISLLNYYHIDIEGKKVVMVGRSMLVGKPTALALLNRNATVTIAHSRTRNLAEICRSADILIVAIGKPEFITAEYVSAGQVVIDVGINALDVQGKRKLAGDVKLKEVGPIVVAISPVPGGVGPMTVASLFENLIQAFHQLSHQ